MNFPSPLNELLHLFFPHVCTGCGSDVLDKDHQLCLRCIYNLPVTRFFSQPGNPVENKFIGRLPIKNAAAGYFFTKNSLLERLIYALKYRGNKDIGFYMGQLVGRMIHENPHYDDVDVLLPLPLNIKRQKKRGYNQSTAICDGIASVINKPVIENAVIRKVYTQTQTRKGRISRWENMDGVFAVSNPAPIENKHVLLVDDVVTTGASLEACGSEMIRVNGITLSMATLAYTI